MLHSVQFAVYSFRFVFVIITFLTYFVLLIRVSHAFVLILILPAHVLINSMQVYFCWREEKKSHFSCLDFFSIRFIGSMSLIFPTLSISVAHSIQSFAPMARSCCKCSLVDWLYLRGSHFQFMSHLVPVSGSFCAHFCTFRMHSVHYSH